MPRRCTPSPRAPSIGTRWHAQPPLYALAQCEYPTREQPQRRSAAFVRVPVQPMRIPGAMRTPPADENAPAGREHPCVTTQREANANRRPKQVLRRPPNWFCASLAMIFTCSVHNVASRPLEEAVATITSGSPQRCTS
ncbi:hypothetical protein B0H19DRAFT_1275450 [Mycena capillaripes]|nr:hypothetical protein B0H19DRAFT_1275450 [Mycena capillaripes]